MIAVAIVLAVAAAMLVRAVVLRMREKALVRRLRPIEARVIDPGRAGSTSALEEAQYQADLRDLHRSQHDGSEPRTLLPSPPTTYYEASWEHEVEGRFYRVTHRQTSLVFPPGRIRAGRVQVYYDPKNPSVGRPSPVAGDEASAWFIGAGVVAAVGLAIAVIAS